MKITIIKRNFIGGSMKATLEFNLPEETIEHKDAINGSTFKAILWDFHQDSIRKRLKYDDSLTDKEYELIEKIQTEFFECIGNAGVSIED